MSILTSKSTSKANEVQEKFFPKRKSSLKVRDSFNRLGLSKRAERVHFCASCLEFAECTPCEYHKLTCANFCRDRLCPMCAWRLSKLHVAQLVPLFRAATEREAMRFLFLTVTIKNVPGPKLGEAIDEILTGWRNLTSRTRDAKEFKRFRDPLLGWMRKLEITYNADADTYHPHIHAVLAVTPSYFVGTSGLYIPHEEWTSLWQHAANLGYEPIVNIKAVKPKRMQYFADGHCENNTFMGAVLEVAKYSVKDASYIRPDETETDKVIYTLAKALHNRRLIDFGLLFRKIRKELNLQDLEAKNADLVGGEDKNCTCPLCNGNLIEIKYVWDFMDAEYRRIEAKKQ